MINSHAFKGFSAAVTAMLVFLLFIPLALGQTANGRLDEATDAEIDDISDSDDTALLTITNTVINDNGGTRSASNFEFTIDGLPAERNTTYVLSPGFHSVIETSDATSGREYTTFWSANCPSGVVFLTAGTDITCSVTNDDLAMVGVGPIDTTPGLGMGGVGPQVAQTPISTLIAGSVIVASLLGVAAATRHNK